MLKKFFHHNKNLSQKNPKQNNNNNNNNNNINYYIYNLNPQFHYITKKNNHQPYYKIFLDSKNSHSKIENNNNYKSK